MEMKEVWSAWGGGCLPGSASWQWMGTMTVRSICHYGNTLETYIVDENDVVTLPHVLARKIMT